MLLSTETLLRVAPAVRVLIISLRMISQLLPDKIRLIGVRAGTGTEHAQYVHQKQEIQLKNKKK
jgi:hypothetical protein